MLGALVVFAMATPRAADVESLVLPGIDLSDADLHVGHWVRYLVIDEAEGVVDSTMVTFAVTGAEKDAYWLEIDSRAGGADGERDAVRVLVDNAITSYAYGDSLYRYVRQLLILKGDSPPEPGDMDRVRRLTLTRPTTGDGWTRTAGVAVDTPAGPVDCELREMTIVDHREVPAGRVTVVRNHEDHFRVWSSDRIPVFHLAKCVIDRSRESRTVPAVQGIPESGPRTSRTTSIVVAFGLNTPPSDP